MWEAFQDLERAISFEVGEQESDLRAVALNNRGYVHLTMGERGKALKDIERSMELLPENPFAYRNRALVRLAEGDERAACADLDKALQHDYYAKFGKHALYGPDVREVMAQHCR